MLRPATVVVLTFGTRHGDDIALEVALENAPCALIYYERRLPREPRVLVSSGHDPRWCVRDALQERIR